MTYRPGKESGLIGKHVAKIRIVGKLFEKQLDV